MVMMMSDIAVSDIETLIRMSIVVSIVDDDDSDGLTEESEEPLWNSLVV